MDMDHIDIYIRLQIMYGHDCFARNDDGKCTTLTDDDCEDIAGHLQLYL